MWIPLSKPSLGRTEIRNCRLALKSNWISSDGPFSLQFEKQFAEYLGTNHALSVSNGTNAVHLALAAINVGEGDEVIIPSFGFVAFANAVLYLGATPVFVDVSINTWCSPLSLIAAAVTAKTKAVIAVHNYGLVDDLDQISQFCKEHDIFLIEDAAEALGGSLNGRKLGTFGDIGTFSFYGNKVITSGEGGAVVTDDIQLLNRMRHLRGQAMDPNRRYFFDEVGYNYRLSNVSSSILLAQLNKLPSLLRDRERVFQTYSHLLSGLDQIQLPNQMIDAVQAPWLFTILVGPKRDLIAKKLADNGIETRPTFYPITDLPAFKSYKSRANPNTSLIAEYGLSLPTFAELNEKQIARVCSLLAGILDEATSVR
jgi:perosamine synthetase